MPRIQLKIVAALSMLVAVVVITSGVLAERGLRSRVAADLEGQLTRRAALVRQQVEGIPFEPASRERLDALAEAASHASEARVTLIAADGSVLGDSDIPLDELARTPNHAGRPEVQTALAGEVGRSARRSDTVKRSLLYLALPVLGPDGGVTGAVRLAMDLDRIDVAAAALRRELIVGGALGLVAALALSFLLSWLSLRPIRELQEVVQEIAEGRLERRLLWQAGDERVEIARSINHMARQMGEQISKATREKARLEAVLASMAEGVLVLDADGRIVHANPRLRELLSVWGELAERRAAEVIRDPGIEAALREALGSSQPLVREIELGAAGEPVLLMHAAGFPASGPRAGTVAVFHDVSELRRLDRVRRDFIANASHELRTPLTAIQGFADTLRGGSLSHEELRPYLDVILRNSQRMASLVDDLLALSRIEGGRGGLEKVSVDLPRLTRTLLSDFQPRLAEARLEASLEAEPEPLQCLGDRQALEQILSNLLSNAVRYTNPGGRIDVRLRAREDGVEIEVADTGIGIPSAEQQRIFERFYRVDAARSRALGGTGLGLSIVKHLVKAMGGEVRVESEIGVGSRFTVRLPRAKD